MPKVKTPDHVPYKPKNMKIELDTNQLRPVFGWFLLLGPIWALLAILFLPHWVGLITQTLVFCGWAAEDAHGYQVAVPVLGFAALVLFMCSLITIGNRVESGHWWWS